MLVDTKPTFCELPELRVVGVEIICTPDDECNIPALWDDFLRRFDELPPYRGVYGACLPRTDNLPGFRYLACVGVDAGTGPPPGFVAAIVPQARYAVWPFCGKPEEMSGAFDEIFNQLLTDHGLKPHPSMQCLEVYAADCMDAASSKLSCDLLVALQ